LNSALRLALILGTALLGLGRAVAGGVIEVEAMPNRTQLLAITAADPVAGPGAKLLQQGKTAEALEFAGAKLQAAPDDESLNRLLVLTRLSRAEDELAIKQLAALAIDAPATAAVLREQLAGAYLRERRLYRAGQQLLAVPGNLRSDQLRYLEANIAARQQRLPEAYRQLEYLAKRNPEIFPVLRDYAQVASLLGKHSTAAAAAERILKLEPGEDDARLLLGKSRLAMGQPLQAERAFASMAVSGRLAGAAALNMGFLQLAQGRPAEARASFRRAWAAEPQDHRAFAAEAAAALLQGDAAAARIAAAAAVRRHPADPVVGLVDTLSASASGATPSPVSVAAAASLFPDLEREPVPASLRTELGSVVPAGRVAVANVLLQWSSPELVLEWLPETPKADTGALLLELTAVRVLATAGDWPAAEARLRRLEASGLSKDSIGAGVQAAAVAAQLGDKAGAVARMQEALSLEPAPPRVHVLAGDFYNALGDPEGAAAQYRAALGALADDPRLLNQLAATLAVIGTAADWEEGLRLAEAALARRPDYMMRARLLDTRADLLFRLNRRAEALAAYRDLSTTVGGITGPEAWHRLGDLALAAGDRGGARKAYEEALDYSRDYPGRQQAIRQLAALEGAGAASAGRQ
jgi:tetratricopeptide (TPR) repeat protein